MYKQPNTVVDDSMLEYYSTLPKGTLLEFSQLPLFLAQFRAQILLKSNPGDVIERQELT